MVTAQLSYLNLFIEVAKWGQVDLSQIANTVRSRRFRSVMLNVVLLSPPSAVTSLIMWGAEKTPLCPPRTHQERGVTSQWLCRKTAKYSSSTRYQTARYSICDVTLLLLWLLDGQDCLWNFHSWPPHPCYSWLHLLLSPGLVFHHHQHHHLHRLCHHSHHYHPINIITIINVIITTTIIIIFLIIINILDKIFSLYRWRKHDLWN